MMTFTHSTVITFLSALKAFVFPLIANRNLAIMDEDEEKVSIVD